MSFRPREEPGRERLRDNDRPANSQALPGSADAGLGRMRSPRRALPLVSRPLSSHLSRQLPRFTRSPINKSAPSFPRSLTASPAREVQRLRSQRWPGVLSLLLSLSSDQEARETPAPATYAAGTRLPWQRRVSASSIRASLTTRSVARAGADGSLLLGRWPRRPCRVVVSMETAGPPSPDTHAGLRASATGGGRALSVERFPAGTCRSPGFGRWGTSASVSVPRSLSC